MAGVMREPERRDHCLPLFRISGIMRGGSRWGPLLQLAHCPGCGAQWALGEYPVRYVNLWPGEELECACGHVEKADVFRFPPSVDAEAPWTFA